MQTLCVSPFCFAFVMPFLPFIPSIQTVLLRKQNTLHFYCEECRKKYATDDPQGSRNTPKSMQEFGENKKTLHAVASITKPPSLCKKKEIKLEPPNEGSLLMYKNWLTWTYYCTRLTNSNDCHHMHTLSQPSSW